MSRVHDGGVLRNIQALRALAALAIVFVHATHEPGLSMPFSYGDFGIHIFFVISGFIVCYIADRDPHQFELKRLIRVVPLYWTLTLFTFVAALVMPGLFHNTSPDPITLLTSLFFIPHDRGHGSIEPMLFVGWTLNYEMYFYLLFAVALRISRRLAPLLAGCTIIVVMLATAIAAPASPAEQFYGNPIVLEFVYGMAIFSLFGATSRPANQNSPPHAALFGAAICAAMICLCLLSESFRAQVLDWVRYELAAALIVGGAVFVEMRRRLVVNSRLILLLGESSYVLYLLHPYVVYGLVRIALRNGARAWPVTTQWVLVALLLAAAAAASVGVHSGFEKPVTNILRKRILKKQPPLIFSEPDALAPAISSV
jgi:peptidoglycan/LPS O-acetylase OafA/YrhL